MYLHVLRSLAHVQGVVFVMRQKAIGPFASRIDGGYAALYFIATRVVPAPRIRVWIPSHVVAQRLLGLSVHVCVCAVRAGMRLRRQEPLNQDKAALGGSDDLVQDERRTSW